MWWKLGKTKRRREGREIERGKREKRKKGGYFNNCMKEKPKIRKNRLCQEKEKTMRTLQR